MWKCSQRRQPEQHGHQAKVGSRAYSQGSEQPAHTSTGQAADAEQSMKRGHDGPAVTLLDRNRLSVHGDIECAVSCAKDEER